MSWPAVRTVPRPIRALGLAPFAAGCAFVILVVPLVAWIAAFCGAMLLDASGLEAPVAVQAVSRIVFLLSGSPLLSPAALVPALPAAFLLARLGWAGWLVALAAGALAGSVAAPLANGSWRPWAWTVEFAVVGAILGGAFWLGARLAAPGLFGPRAAP